MISLILSFTATEQGAAAKQAADNKTAKYQELEKTYILFPVAIQTDIHGVSRPWNWCRRSRDASQPSLRIAGKQSFCFTDCAWLYKGETRSHS